MTAVPRIAQGLRGPGLAGAVGLLLLLGGFGLWSATTMIGGAVVAQGQVVVHGKPKLVQSLDGGIVAEIAVADGDRVTEGQVLLRLDPTLLTINLDIARARLADALARKARLEAEQAGLPAPVFAAPLLPFAALDTAGAVAGQREIFTARAEVLRGRRDRLTETLRQLEAQTAGTRAQMAALRDQLGYLRGDLDNTRRLVDQGLARLPQLTDLQRQEADLVGRLAALEAELAQLPTAARDAELETLQGERSFKEEVVTELRAVTATADELILDIATRSAQLGRIAVRAPVDGVVHDMQVTTRGGVVAPGATILEIVPQGRGVDFELRVDPRAIDQVHPGQQAQVVLSAFDPRTTPRLTGTVSSISADAILDPRSGQSYYRVGLTLSQDEIARLDGAVPLPGMPVDAFLQTGARSVLDYLLAPLSVHLRRAFREE